MNNIYSIRLPPDSISHLRDKINEAYKKINRTTGLEVKKSYLAWKVLEKGLDELISRLNRGEKVNLNE